MPGPGPRAVLDAPELLPPLYGLLHSVEPFTGDERWVSGGYFEPIGCGGDVSVILTCNPATKPAATRADAVAVEAFGIVAPTVCSAMASPGRDFEAMARRKLEACQSAAIESELWSGTLITTNPRLASTASSDISGGSPDTPSDGLAIMEGALADCGCGHRGMIHMTRKVASLLIAQGLLEPTEEPGFRRPVLQTKLGTIVVAGAGYPGTAPDGSTTAGAQWIYGTGLVNVALGDIEVFGPVADGTDRSLNTITVRAERPALAWFDPCCHLALSITAPATPAGV